MVINITMLAMCALRVTVFFLVSFVMVKLNSCTLLGENRLTNLGIINIPPAIKQDVCKTKGCIQSSKRFKENMDKSVNPCNDFYRFACGNFLKTKKIPKKEVEISIFTKMGESLLKLIRPLFQNGKKLKKDNRAFKMARYLYNICLREDLIESRGIGRFLKLLKDAGGWPVLEGQNWNESNYNWIDTTFKLQDKQLPGDLIKVLIKPDVTDTFVHVVQIDQITFVIDRVYLVQGRKNKRVEAYGRFMTDIAKLLGASHSSALKEMEDVLNFEIELAKITLSPEERRKPFVVRWKLAELQSRQPIVNWKQFLKKSFKKIVSFKSNDEVFVAAVVYLEKLYKLLNETDKRTIANYQFWIAVFSKSQTLKKAITNRVFEFKKETGGAKERIPRWKLCLITVISTFSLAVSSMYVRNVFNTDLKGIITDMVNRIRQEMIVILEKVSWMDKETRTKAIEKAKAMQLHVAYPDELLDDKKIKKYYKKLNIIGDPLYEAISKCEEFSMKKGFHDFHKRINKTDWRSHGGIVEVNAAYSSTENSIRIPAGILQEVIVSPDLPMYMVYGVLGIAIGHEITHAFDDKGRLSDKEGNMIDWWKNETIDKFEERIQCVVDQANNYTIKSVNMNLNGINLQGEVISDLGGAKLAMAAYNKLEQTFKEAEPRLVGFEQFSTRQMFWITAANSFCWKMTKDAMRDMILTNEHPPQEYRIINSLRNHETFGNDFKCSKGSPMNPIEKCVVW